MAQDLLTLSDIGRLIGVTRQRVAQLAAEPGFPKAHGTTGYGRVWKRSDIEKWARKTGRLTD